VRAGVLGLVALVAVTPACAAEIGAGALDHLPPADVVILGEVHDNPSHHRNQARAVAAIGPRALVFEMLTEAQAARMPADRRDAGRVARALGWDRSGWPDFAMYHPILLAAPAARVFGGDLPSGAVAQSLQDGAAAAFGAEAAPYGLAEPLDPADQSAREAEMQAAHCDALPPEVLPGMVEAQRLRDATLARAVVRAWRQSGGPVVLIAGTGHARTDRGVPAVLARAAPELSVLAVGQIEGAAAPVQPFDLWIVTGVAPRGDPCAGFGIRAAIIGRSQLGG
jgi:uncharacterized iron-regulated protein